MGLTQECSHITCLRASAHGRPLFLFPGAGDDATSFDEVTRALPERQAVYAVELHSLCERIQNPTVEKMALAVLQMIRNLQPTGPYNLCGYSFGGLVAYEVATQLASQSQTVHVLALLDTPNPALLANLSAAESNQFRSLYFKDRIARNLRPLLELDFKGLARNILHIAKFRLGILWIPLLKLGLSLTGRELPLTLRFRHRQFSKPWRTFVPKRSPHRLLCFRVDTRGPEYDRDPSMGWSTLALGGIDVQRIPGLHEEMLAMPAAGVIAEKLTGYLAQNPISECD